MTTTKTTRIVASVKVEAPSSLRATFDQEKNQFKEIYEYLSKFSTFTMDVKNQMDGLPQLVNKLINEVNFDEHPCLSNQRAKIKKLENKQSDSGKMLDELVKGVKVLQEKEEQAKKTTSTLRMDVDNIRCDVQELQKSNFALLNQMIEDLQAKTKQMETDFELHRAETISKLEYIEDDKAHKSEVALINQRLIESELRINKMDKILMDTSEPSRISRLEQQMGRQPQEIKSQVELQIENLRQELDKTIDEKVTVLIKSYLDENMNTLVEAVIEEYVERELMQRFKNMVKDMLDKGMKKLEGKGNKAIEAWCFKTFADKSQNDRDHAEIHEILKSFQVEFKPPPVKVKFKGKGINIPFTRLGGTQTKMFRNRRGSFTQLDQYNNQALSRTQSIKQASSPNTRPKSGMPSMLASNSFV